MSCCPNWRPTEGKPAACALGVFQLQQNKCRKTPNDSFLPSPLAPLHIGSFLLLPSFPIRKEHRLRVFENRVRCAEAEVTGNFKACTYFYGRLLHRTRFMFLQGEQLGLVS
jgi:hypothetical protein